MTLVQVVSILLSRNHSINTTERNLRILTGFIMSHPFRQRRVVEETHTFSSTAIIHHPQEKLNSQIVFGWGRFNDHMSRTQHRKVKHEPKRAPATRTRELGPHKIQYLLTVRLRLYYVKFCVVVKNIFPNTFAFPMLHWIKDFSNGKLGFRLENAWHSLTLEMSLVSMCPHGSSGSIRCR